MLTHTQNSKTADQVKFKSPPVHRRTIREEIADLSVSQCTSCLAVLPHTLLSMLQRYFVCFIAAQELIWANLSMLYFTGAC
jgi:hypothetical protein